MLPYPVLCVCSSGCPVCAATPFCCVPLSCSCPALACLFPRLRLLLARRPFAYRPFRNIESENQQSLWQEGPPKVGPEIVHHAGAEGLENLGLEGLDNYLPEHGNNQGTGG